MAGACLISGEFLRMYRKSESGPQRLVFEKSGIHEKEYSMGCAQSLAILHPLDTF